MAEHSTEAMAEHLGLELSSAQTYLKRLYRKLGLADDRQPVKPVTYPVIKTALLGLTRYLATYWHEAGVRCNALSPGGVFNGQSEEFVARLSHLIPLGRMAGRDE